MKIGQILVQRGVIDRDQLRAALARQAYAGRPLGEILIAMGVASRAAVIAALRSQPHGSVDAAALAALEPASAAPLPPELARRCRALPVVRLERAMVVAMADPTDRDAIERIAAACGLPVVAVAAPEDALAQATDRIYGPATAAAPGRLAS